MRGPQDRHPTYASSASESDGVQPVPDADTDDEDDTRSEDEDDTQIASRLSDLGERALGALIDDFERGGRAPLTQEHVNRVLEKRGVGATDLILVFQGLLARGVKIAPDDAPNDAEAPAKDEPTESNGISVPDGFARYMQRIRRLGLLTRAEEVALGRSIELGRRLQQDGGSVSGDRQAARIAKQAEDARARLIEQNIRLVLSIARRFASLSDLTLEDLVQEGTLGLMRAVEKFDHTLGYKFSTYATWWITQAITRALADKGRMIRLPVHLAEEYLRVQRARRLLGRHLAGKEPSPKLIADELDLDLSRVHFLLGLDRLIPASLDEPLDGMDVPLGELVPAPDPSPEALAISTERLERVLTVISSLEPREQDVVKRRFGFLDGVEWTLDRIGQHHGVTRERIRQIEAKVLKKLRKRSERFGLMDYVDQTSRERATATDRK